MSSYKKVLIAVDVYDQAQSLLDEAKAFVEGGSDVHLCTAVLPLEHMYSLAPIGSHSIAVSGFQNELKTNSEAGLKTLAEKLGIKEENVHVLIGKAGNEIKRLADDEAFDLIVVGTHGKKAIRSMLGSTLPARSVPARRWSRKAAITCWPISPPKLCMTRRC